MLCVMYVALLRGSVMTPPGILPVDEQAYRVMTLGRKRWGENVP